MSNNYNLFYPPKWYLSANFGFHFRMPEFGIVCAAEIALDPAVTDLEAFAEDVKKNFEVVYFNLDDYEKYKFVTIEFTKHDVEVPNFGSVRSIMACIPQKKKPQQYAKEVMQHVLTNFRYMCNGEVFFCERPHAMHGCAE